MPRDVYGNFKRFSNWNVDLVNVGSDYGVYRVFVKCVLPAPLKQLVYIKDSSQVICKQGLELIFKSSNGSPACVKPKTAEKLIERGWAS